MLKTRAQASQENKLLAFALALGVQRPAKPDALGSTVWQSVPWLFKWKAAKR